VSAWKIICGDALMTLRTIRSGTVSAIITDPPYCSGGASEAGRAAARCQGVRTARMQRGDVTWFLGDNLGTAGLVWLLRALAFEASRILAPGGSMLVFCDWRMCPNLVPALESGGLRLVNLLVWDKKSMGMGTGFRMRHELIAHFCNGVGKFHDKTAANVLPFNRVHVSRREHPTEKPVDLLRALVRVVSPPTGVVVDPFCGSGSTGVACLAEGRHFVGIEREEAYCELSRSRLSAACLEPTA